MNNNKLPSFYTWIIEEIKKDFAPLLEADNQLEVGLYYSFMGRQKRIRKKESAKILRELKDYGLISFDYSKQPNNKFQGKKITFPTDKEKGSITFALLLFKTFYFIAKF